MSSPASDLLVTPPPSRSGRIRRPVKAFGNMVSSDTISDPEDAPSDGEEDEDEEGSDDEFAGAGSEPDEVDEPDEDDEADSEADKGKRAGKKGHAKSPSAVSKQSSKPSKPSKPSEGAAKEPKRDDTKAKKPSKAKPVLVKPAASKSKFSVSKFTKPVAKAPPTPPSDQEDKGEADDEAQDEAENDENVPLLSDKGPHTPKTPLSHASKSASQAPKSSSTTASTTTKPKPKAKGIVLAKKAPSATETSKTSATGKTKPGKFSPLKPGAGAQKKATQPAPAKDAKPKPRAKKTVAESDDEEDDDDTAVAARDHEASDNEPEDSVNKKASPSTMTVEPELSPAPDDATADESVAVNPLRGKKTYSKHKLSPATQKAAEITASDDEADLDTAAEDDEGAVDPSGKPALATDDDSQNDEHAEAEQTPPPKTTPKKRKASNEPSSSESSPRKLAPAEKVTTDMRVAIIDALVAAAYVGAVDFKTVANRLTADGEAVTSAKLSRHWREVLSADLRAHVRGEGTPKKGGKASGKAGGLTAGHRRAIWDAVVGPYEKADWKAIEAAHGMSTTKLRRHFRDVMIKEVVKAIGH